jgi:VRR-NUC domain.
MSEIDLVRSLQKLASTLGARLFRQNTGMAWAGKVERGFPGKRVTLGPADVVVRNARPFHAGVPGMSDLGGWAPVVVTPEMVGATIAVYAQVEVKAGARTTGEQKAWIDAVAKAGGFAGVARDESDLRKILHLK